jgi:hypothetical protein
MDSDTNWVALSLIVIGAGMNFGRQPLTRFYLWLYQRGRNAGPQPRLEAAVRLYLVFTSFILTVVGILGLLKILRY